MRRNNKLRNALGIVFEVLVFAILVSGIWFFASQYDTELQAEMGQP